jgi:drug/metabolite transporter (DMT)-like permease
MNNASDNLRGAVFMMLSMAGYVVNDTLMKLVAEDIPLAQSVFIRGLMATAMLAGFAAYKHQLFVRVPLPELRIILLRAFGEIAATYCYLTALIHMPLANITAILQSLPLAVTLAGALFLGHKVGWRRYVAIIVGFAGVLIIVRPGGADFNSYALWAMAAVGFITLRDLMAAKLAKETPSMFVALFTAAGVTMAAAIMAQFEPWSPVSGGSFAYLAFAAGFILVGYITSISAMRYGEIAFVSPFRYTVLVWALLLGVFVFKDYPDFWTMTGIAIVVGTGVFTFYREQQARKRAGIGEIQI